MVPQMSCATGTFFINCRIQAENIFSG